MQLHVRNFRSIRKLDTLEVAPLTVLYGANGAGKSSLIYSLLTFKNIVLNPNQMPNGFFNYIFANLGDYEAVVFDHNNDNSIEMSIDLVYDEVSVHYEVTVKKSTGRFGLWLSTEAGRIVEMYLDVTFPYALNQNSTLTFNYDNVEYVVNWNGVVAQVQSLSPLLEEDGDMAAVLNAPAELLRKTRVVPLKRGFSKPHYSSVSVSPLMITEDEVATYLSNNKYLVPKLSRYLEQIVGRDFRINYQPGTSVFSLDSTDRTTGLASELVNEGFGVNQIVHFLAVCLHPDSKVICVEEPEIHLHPTAVRRLAQALAEISNDEGKTFLISTHSEAFLSALLTSVAQGNLSPSQIACYYVHKAGKSASFERQRVSEKGQIEGGLTSFLEGELEDIRILFKIAE